MGWALHGAGGRHGATIQRDAHWVQHSPKPGIGNRQGGPRRQRGAHAGGEPRQWAKRNSLGLAIPETRDFRHDRRADMGRNRHTIPNGRKRAKTFKRDGETRDGIHAAMHLFARQGTKGGGSGVEINHGVFLSPNFGFLPSHSSRKAHKTLKYSPTPKRETEGACIGVSAMQEVATLGELKVNG
jgi:hypothetical protein